MSQIDIIDEHPIPLSEERATELQESLPTFDAGDEVLHPDELHERYKDVLARNHEWSVFRSLLYGHSGYVFCWNHQLGHGIRFYDQAATGIPHLTEDGEGSFESFVEVLAEAISLD